MLTEVLSGQSQSSAGEEKSKLEESHCYCCSADQLNVSLVENFSALYTGKIVGRLVIFRYVEEIAGLRDEQHNDLFFSFTPSHVDILIF